MLLRDWLKARHMTARDFADKVGVDRSTVGRWISGESVPQRDHYPAIATVTGSEVTANDFLLAAASFKAPQPVNRVA